MVSTSGGRRGPSTSVRTSLLVLVCTVAIALTLTPEASADSVVTLFKFQGWQGTTSTDVYDDLVVWTEGDNQGYFVDGGPGVFASRRGSQERNRVASGNYTGALLYEHNMITSRWFDNSNGPSGQRLVLINVNTGAERQITTGDSASPYPYEFDSALAFDGRTCYFTRLLNDGTAIPHGYDFIAVDVVTGQESLLRHDWPVAFAESIGTSVYYGLYYAMSDPRSVLNKDLHRLNLLTGDDSVVYTGKCNALDPFVTDGRYIAFGNEVFDTQSGLGQSLGSINYRLRDGRDGPVYANVAGVIDGRVYCTNNLTVDSSAITPFWEIDPSTGATQLVLNMEGSPEDTFRGFANVHHGDGDLLFWWSPKGKPDERYTMEFVPEAVTPNTSAGYSQVVRLPSGVTVAFDTVEIAGQTRAEESTAPGGHPGFRIVGAGNYDISTSASFAGPVTITLPYDESEVPAGAEGRLKLFHWKNNGWEDVTVSVDTVNNTVTGRASSLSPFAVMSADNSAPPTVSTPASSPGSIALFIVLALLLILKAPAAATSKARRPTIQNH